MKLITVKTLLKLKYVQTSALYALKSWWKCKAAMVRICTFQSKQLNNLKMEGGRASLLEDGFLCIHQQFENVAWESIAILPRHKGFSDSSTCPILRSSMVQQSIIIANSFLSESSRAHWMPHFNLSPVPVAVFSTPKPTLSVYSYGSLITFVQRRNCRCWFKTKDIAWPAVLHQRYVSTSLGIVSWPTAFRSHPSVGKGFGQPWS